MSDHEASEEHDSITADDALQEALATALVANGTIGRIRAQLRAAALGVIRNDDKLATLGGRKPPQDGAAAISVALVIDFLDRMGYLASKGVFEAEASHDDAPDLDEVAAATGVSAQGEPMLMQLVRQSMSGGGQHRAASATAVSSHADPVAHQSPSAAAKIANADSPNGHHVNSRELHPHPQHPVNARLAPVASSRANEAPAVAAAAVAPETDTSVEYSDVSGDGSLHSDEFDIVDKRAAAAPASKSAIDTVAVDPVPQSVPAVIEPAATVPAAAPMRGGDDYEDDEYNFDEDDDEF